MSNILEEHVEVYIDKLLPKEGALEEELREYAEQHHIPVLERESVGFLKLFLKILKPKRILELGTAIGYSALVMSETLPELEELVTVELREDMTRRALSNLKRGNADNVTVLNMDAMDALEQVEGPFQFIFIDAAKGQYRKYFDKSEKLLAQGGVILCDNVLFRGMISNQDLVKRRKITIVKRLRSFLHEMFADPRWDCTIIPLGDGMLLARRRDEKS